MAKDPTDVPDGERPPLTIAGSYSMSADEQIVFDLLKAAFPLTTQTVVAVRETLSHHWEAQYIDGTWYLIVSHVGIGVHGGAPHRTHLGDDSVVFDILSNLFSPLLPDPLD